MAPSARKALKTTYKIKIGSKIAPLGGFQNRVARGFEPLAEPDWVLAHNPNLLRRISK